jgi:ABC-type Fe3+ transport system substrate-binding protein
MRLLSLSLACALAAHCAAAQAAEPSLELAKVIEAAKKEGKLNLTWASDLLGGIGAVREMGDGMNAMFGTRIAIRFTPGPSLPEVVNQVMIAVGAGRPSPTDAVIGSDQHASALAHRSISVPVDWVSLLPGRITPDTVEVEGRSIRVFTTLPGGIIYNTALAPMRPEKLVDLLRPEWKGKVASTPYASSWELLGGSDLWGKHAVEFARQLSGQLAGLMRCAELERIASGEFPAFAMDCTGREWMKLKRKGAPIEHVVPADFAAQRFYYFSVPKNASNPNAAILFVTFLESTQGQKLLYKLTDTDLMTYPDSELLPEIRAYEARGIVFHPFSVKWHDEHPEGQDVLRQAVKILAGG